jgi:hypothetical protein
MKCKENTTNVHNVAWEEIWRLSQVVITSAASFLLSISFWWIMQHAFLPTTYFCWLYSSDTKDDDET